MVYLSDKYASTAATLASKRMMDAAGVTYRQLVPSIDSITLDFGWKRNEGGSPLRRANRGRCPLDPCDFLKKIGQNFNWP